MVAPIRKMLKDHLCCLTMEELPEGKGAWIDGMISGGRRIEDEN